ncbi:MAG: hypothetical protein HOH37_06000 [Gammaproteobacteria bacterium]|nr:hypothetical protein [Gammaproteobacteria bacterium]
MNAYAHGMNLMYSIKLIKSSLQQLLTTLWHFSSRRFVAILMALLPPVFGLLAAFDD